jgi:RNA polymerase sigma-70 factor (ECF subfamily)
MSVLISLGCSATAWAFIPPRMMNDPGGIFGSTREASDAELIARMAKGDTGAVASFYDRHSPLLFSIALRIVGDRREAEETLQDAMRCVWENAPLYEPSQGKPMSWAVVITRNRAIDRLRRLKRQSEAITRIKEQAESSLATLAKTPLPEAVSNEDRAQLHAALAALPAAQRLAIELAFFGGLSQSEIAEELGEPLGTIKARIRRGMLALREVLEEAR